MSRTYGQSTKESYRDDIEISRKHKTVYKNFEWLDDHTYCNSDKLGICIQNDDDETLIYFFQRDGPKNIDDLRKFLEWRRSGISNEIGHKGGGNKRNIYGYDCNEAHIFMKTDEKNVITCGTRPNKLYELSKSKIDEEKFRSECDSSTYIINPEKIKIKNLPSWYEKTYNKIKEESDISPNFLIRLELTKIPEEYTNKFLWNEYLNQIRAKQYNIPIKFKNELLDMEEYKSYDNIDLIGFEDPKKIKVVNLKLYININTKKDFYFKVEDKYINVKNKKEISDFNGIIEWGKIEMFIVSKLYMRDELKKYNYLNENTKRAEDFYGPYLILNDKLINYLPFEGKILGDSRNNGINCEEGIKNNGRFRMIFKPNKENCENNDIFDSLIQTREIKALTGFLENSPFKEIKDCAIKLYIGENIVKKVKPTKKTIVKVEKTKEGGIYLIYLNNGLWKYGMVTDYENLSDRISKHKQECMKTIKDFLDVLNKKEVPKNNFCIVVYEKKIKSACGAEEKIKEIIEEKKVDKIKLIKSNRSSNETREYFVCDDFDYVYNDILNKIKEVFECHTSS